MRFHNFWRCVLFFAFFGFFPNAFSAPKDIRVRAEGDWYQGKANSYFKGIRISFVEQGVLDPVTGRPTSKNSPVISVPPAGYLRATKPKALSSFIDPYALSAMLEEALQSGSLTLHQSLDLVRSDNWMLKTMNYKNSKLLKPPKNYRAQFQSNLSSGVGTNKDFTLVITGPGIMDPQTRRPAALISVPIYDFQVVSARKQGSVSPYVLAALIEQALQSESITARQVSKIISRPE